MPETPMTPAQVLRAAAPGVRDGGVGQYVRLTIYLDDATGGDLNEMHRAIVALREHLGVPSLGGWCNARYRTAAEVADAMLATADHLDQAGGAS